MPQRRAPWHRSYSPWLALTVLAAALVGTRRAERALLHRWEEGPAGPVVALPGPPRARTVHTDDGAALRVLEWGAGPPVLLVHGITATAEDWLAVVPHLLAAGRRVVAVEQRGHGGSSLGTGRCDTRRLAQDLAQAIEQLDLRDAVLVGHSLGGYVSLALAGYHAALVRERLTALVLLGAPHTGRGARELATLATVAAPWTPALQRSNVEGAITMGLVAFGPAPDRRQIDEVRLRWARCSPRARRCFARHLAGERVTPLLGHIELPVVVARGATDHIVTARRNAQLVRQLRNARYHELPGAGHALLPEEPHAVAELIVAAAQAG